nr:unnamed protein product [Digitaria exilis]
MFLAKWATSHQRSARQERLNGLATKFAASRGRAPGGVVGTHGRQTQTTPTATRRGDANRTNVSGKWADKARVGARAVRSLAARARGAGHQDTIALASSPTSPVVHHRSAHTAGQRPNDDTPTAAPCRAVCSPSRSADAYGERKLRVANRQLAGAREGAHHVVLVGALPRCVPRLAGGGDQGVPSRLSLSISSS